MNFYKTRQREFGKTWAILNEKNEVIVCDWRQAKKWRKAGGEQRSRIKFNRVGLQEIETRFVGESASLDGPHFFWRVSLNIYVDSRKDPNPIPFQQWVMKSDAKQNSPWLKEGAQSFATREEALAFHEEVRKQASEQLRLSRTKPERTQVLLAELSRWCAQKWGRQAHVAREVGTTAQTVNDWLSGRKRMTGEQTLRVYELLQKENRRRKQEVSQ
jgi:hypothetical protein